MPKIDDVAARAGVSKTTVSHVLTGNRPVSAKTRDHVLRIIEDMKFRPNSVAQSLRNKSSYATALIIPDIMNPFFPAMARGFQDTMVAHGYSIFLCITDAQQKQEEILLSSMLQRQVDGLAIASFHDVTEIVRATMSPDFPCVAIDSIVSLPNVDIVTSDGPVCAAEATRYLLSRGHRRIGMIGGALDIIPSRDRIAGYRRALEEAQIPYNAELVVSADFFFTSQGGETAMEHLLSLTERPTAVFCATDLLAIGAIKRAHTLGFRVPEDVAVMGYDDIDVASLISPALTTMRNPSREVGAQVARLLLDRITGEYQGQRRIVSMSHPLIVRDSA